MPRHAAGAGRRVELSGLSRHQPLGRTVPRPQWGLQLGWDLEGMQVPGLKGETRRGRRVGGERSGFSSPSLEEMRDVGGSTRTTERNHEASVPGIWPELLRDTPPNPSPAQKHPSA